MEIASQRVYNDDSKYRKGHLKKLATMGPTFMPTYTLQGFVFAFKIWLLETYPNSKTTMMLERYRYVHTLGCALSDGTPFLKNDYDLLFQVRNRLRTLTPSSDEMKQKWWRMSLEYFHNVSKVDVRTNVYHDVDEGLSVPDVHHEVEEGLSPSCGSDVKAGNKELMCVDSSVKTSCATDINANNVHNDSMDFDHDPKQNEFDQNVADKNLIHDFDQTVEWETLVNDEDSALEEPQLSGPNFIIEEHQQVSSKNCEVPLAGAKKIAVDALMNIINFDIPKESPIQPMVIDTPVEGCKSGETSKSMISKISHILADSLMSQ
ncbi:hypothetical protein Tco_1213327 [Tanacetum coccineum]